MSRATGRWWSPPSTWKSWQYAASPLGGGTPGLPACRLAQSGGICPQSGGSAGPIWGVAPMCVPVPLWQNDHAGETAHGQKEVDRGSPRFDDDNDRRLHFVSSRNRELVH